MNESKHTPGTWFVDPDDADFTVASDHGQAICRCLTADDFPCLEEGTEDHMNAEAEANARLIAAAPDLLTALQEVVRLAESTTASRTNPNTTFIDTRDWEAILSRARAAIDKATTET